MGRGLQSEDPRGLVNEEGEPRIRGDIGGPAGTGKRGFVASCSVPPEDQLGTTEKGYI